jgi:hypothetical protein
LLALWPNGFLSTQRDQRAVKVWKNNSASVAGDVCFTPPCSVINKSLRTSMKASFKSRTLRDSTKVFLRV